jgi:hypothetical protein
MVELTEQGTLARLAVRAQAEYLSTITDLVRGLAGKQGLDGRAVEHFAFAVEEACSNIITRAYPPDKPGPIEVGVLHRPGKLVIALQDQGLPFDFQELEEGEPSSLAKLLHQAFDGEIHCQCLGRDGNRVELIKELPSVQTHAAVAPEEIARDVANMSAAVEAAFTLCFMKPEESVALARCLYRCYGYSYDCDYMYDAGKIAELQKSGLMDSCVAMNPQGEVVGHLALNLRQPGDKVGEAAQAIVDPRYRGHGLFEKMKAFLMEQMRSRGLYGIYSEAVTLHPYSQKGNLAVGAHETGLLLGYIPASVSYKDIKDLQKQRQAVALFFVKLNEPPARPVFVPARHEAMVRRIYEHNHLPRQAGPVPGRDQRPVLPPQSRLDVRVRTDHNSAFLLVREFGQDLEGLVRFRLRELCCRHIDCIYLDLPLSDPAAAQFSAGLERLGFFFGGIIPEYSDGDVLRLQYLNNLTIDPQQIQLASDFGKELLAYVLQARAAAPQVLFH